MGRRACFRAEWLSDNRQATPLINLRHFHLDHLKGGERGWFKYILPYFQDMIRKTTVCELRKGVPTPHRSVFWDLAIARNLEADMYPLNQMVHGDRASSSMMGDGPLSVL